MLLSRQLIGDLTEKDKNELSSWINWPGGVVVSAYVSDSDSGKKIAEEQLLAIALHAVKTLPGVHICTFLRDFPSFALLMPEVSPRGAGLLLAKCAPLPSGMEIYFGISNQASPQLEGLHNAYLQSLEALYYRFYKNPEQIYYYDEIAVGMTAPLPNLEMLDLERLLDARDTHAIFDACKRMQSILTTKPQINPWRVKKHVHDMIVSLLEQNCRIRRYPHEKKHLLKEASAMLADVNNMDMLVSACHTTLSAMCLIEAKAYDSEDSGLITICLAWLEENLSKPLSLQEVAERFYFNPSYLSGLIKQQTGMPFSRYMHSIRMRRAKELLLNTTLLVHDVANQTGYPDPRYFNRVFRQETGMPPNQFRRTQLSKEH